MPRRNQRTSDDDRRRIVECFNDGGNFVALAATLRINRCTAYSIIRCYQRHGRTDSTHAGGRPRVIDNETLDLPVMLIEANLLITLKILNEEIRAVSPLKPRFDDATLSRALDGKLITLKQCRDCSAERNSPTTKDAHHAYCQWMLADGLQLEKVYVDENGFNLWIKRIYGRTRVGERVNRRVGGKRGRNVTVITAISDKVGVLYHEIHCTSETNDSLSRFVRTLEQFSIGRNAVIILDNASVHNQMADIYPELTFKYLPPYSPFLHPIENCFSVFKAYLDKRTRCCRITTRRLTHIWCSALSAERFSTKDVVVVPRYIHSLYAILKLYN